MPQKLRIRLLLISGIVLITALSIIALWTWRTTSQLELPSVEVEVFSDAASGLQTEQTFETVQVIADLNRSLWWGILVAGLMALLCISLLTYRALVPIEQLTQAVQQMSSGDLSKRIPIRSHDEIGALAHAFNQMAMSLQRDEQLRRNLMNNVAHELRSPLTNMQCQLETLQDGLAEPTPAIIDSLHAETLLLKEIVGDLQELALAEAGRLVLHRQSVALPQIVTTAIQAVTPAAQAKQIQIMLPTPANLPMIHADPGRIKQVVRNLLDNAVQYASIGSQISIGLAEEEHYVTLRVADSGPGIAPEHLPHIFDRFYRGDPSRSRDTGGTGLGLAIAKQFVEAHGGQIWGESHSPFGATFVLKLPIK